MVGPMNALISGIYPSRMRRFVLAAALILSVVSVPADTILSGTYVDVEVAGRKQKIVDGQGLAMTLFNTGDFVISGTGATTYYAAYESATIPIIWLRTGSVGKNPANTNVVFEGATLSFGKDGLLRGTNELGIVSNKTRLMRYYTLKLIQP
jgi:hypothetical protein